VNGLIQNAGIVLDPILPLPVIALLGLLLLAATVLGYRRIGESLSPARNPCLLIFRCFGLALVLLLLLRPSRQELILPPTRERVTLVGIDTSRSMAQSDVERATRLDAAKTALLEAGAVTGGGLSADPHLRFFQFHSEAKPITRSVLDLQPEGTTTRLHHSVAAMLNSLARSEAANALILLTDGHDFEMINPAKTGAAARARQVPIFAVPLGKLGQVRDVSARITSFQPYCYVKQKSRVSANLRLIGSHFEDLTVQLIRRGEVVQTRRINAEEFQELPVEFEVVEPAVGQYEYEVRVQPLPDEVDPNNNSAITYLNVIDQQVRVLILEADPYWDTTFLQRSLMRNDKFEVDSLVRYGPRRIRALRKSPGDGELRLPANPGEFLRYDVVILGRAIDQLLSKQQIEWLDQYVETGGGTVIFSRGPAFQDSRAAGDLEPILWGAPTRGRVRLQVTPEGRSFSALPEAADPAGEGAGLPELISGREPGESKPLAAPLAVASSPLEKEPVPAVVHRRYGKGQVVSIGVEGLWRWCLNAKVDGANTPFDRFWDQMILWLLAGRDFIPSSQFSFRTSSANIQLGEKVYFRLVMRVPDASVKSVPLTLYLGDAEIARANLSPKPADPSRLTADFLPEKIGRYRAVANFPDGRSQESRFIVYTENLEETEVTADAGLLRRLCESSGGRVIEPGDLGRLLKELTQDQADVTPKTRLKPVWNEAWVFYLAGLLFGLDWYLRRRWGLC
jgi:hypothetical protein